MDMIRTGVAAGLALAMPLVLGFAAEARSPTLVRSGGIVCDHEFQTVEGQPVATPYCEDKYIAKVARDHGENVRGAQIRSNPALKNETCRLVDDDDRVSQFCDDEEDND
jgi:hypothetical protein